MSSRLAQHLDEYLAMRHALGFKLKEQGRLMRRYVAYLDRLGATVITIGSALEWATQPADADSGYWAARLGAVRVFARHMTGLDSATEVPPTELLRARHPRATPFLYSSAEIAALMAAADRIRTPLLAATYRTLIGLLAVTGMRVGEVINLDRDHIDRDEGVIVVRDGKFGKSREVALHPSTVVALEDYARLRDQTCPQPNTRAWFIASTGTRLIYQNVHHRFHELTQSAGLASRSIKCRPRIHDLRHTFAVNTLLGWYQAGDDVQTRLPLLSTYLGHVHPGCTYWYLSAAPELMHLVAERLDPVGPVG